MRHYANYYNHGLIGFPYKIKNRLHPLGSQHCIDGMGQTQLIKSRYDLTIRWMSIIQISHSHTAAPSRDGVVKVTGLPSVHCRLPKFETETVTSFDSHHIASCAVSTTMGGLAVVR